MPIKFIRNLLIMVDFFKHILRSKISVLLEDVPCLMARNYGDFRDGESFLEESRRGLPA